jgi:Flp pilus assembly protein CpaB
MLRSPRALALRVGAVIVTVTTAAVVASDLAKLHRRANDLGPERSVVVARHGLRLGTTLTVDDVRVRSVHSSQVPPRVLRDVRHAVGRVITVPVVRDGFVAAANLAPRHRSGLDGALPEGTRAVRVVVLDAVRPRVGAAVDVMASFEGGVGTFDAEEAGADDLEALGSATIVADGVLVLGVDTTRTAEGASALGVTLLVTPRQARDLAFAATHGVVTIALVPPEDAQP